MRLFLKNAQNRLHRHGLHASYKLGLLRLLYTKKPKILAYHGVAPRLETPLNWRHIDPELFEQHLLFLKKYTHVITLKDFFAGNYLPGKKNIAITFDDGYKNNYTYAYPILKKYNIPATIFVSGINETSYSILWADLMDIAQHISKDILDINGKRFYKSNNIWNKAYYTSDGIRLGLYLKHLPFEERMDKLLNINGVKDKLNSNYFGEYWNLLSDEEIAEMDRSNVIDIGAHGYYHNNLGSLNLDEAKKELESVREYLHRITGENKTSIAYPDGSYTREVINLTESVGYKEQCAINYLFDEDINDSRIINRYGLYSFETFPMHFYTMIS